MRHRYTDVWILQRVGTARTETWRYDPRDGMITSFSESVLREVACTGQQAAEPILRRRQ